MIFMRLVIPALAIAAWFALYCFASLRSNEHPHLEAAYPGFQAMLACGPDGLLHSELANDAISDRVEGFDDTALERVRHKAELGSATAMYELAMYYLVASEAEDASSLGQAWMIAASGAGQPAAQLELANFRLFGDFGLDEDVPQAIKWFESSAAGGDGLAHYMLGRHLSEQWHDNIDAPAAERQARAIGHFVTAASTCYPPALINVADALEAGYGIERNRLLSMRLRVDYWLYVSRPEASPREPDPLVQS